MDHHNPRELLSFGRVGQQPLHLAGPLGRRISDRLRFDAWIIRLHLLRPGVVRSEAGQQCFHSHSAHRKDAKPLEILTPPNAAVGIIVIQIQDLLLKLRRVAYVP